MKPYSFAEFNKHFNMFGWLHPDIRQTYWTKEDRVYDYTTRETVVKLFTLSTLWYKEQRVIQFYTNDESNGDRRMTPYNYFRDNSYDNKLTTTQSYRTNANTLMDALYYKANSIEFYNKNGTLKKVFGEH